MVGVENLRCLSKVIELDGIIDSDSRTVGPESHNRVSESHALFNQTPQALGSQRKKWISTPVFRGAPNTATDMNAQNIFTFPFKSAKEHLSMHRHS